MKRIYLKGCDCMSCLVDREIGRLLAKHLADKVDAEFMADAAQNSSGKDQDHEDTPDI